LIYLNNCELICIDTKNKIEALIALDICLDKVNFLNCKFFTDNIDDIKINKFKNIKKIEIIQIAKIKNKSEYSKFCLVDLPKYIDSDFCLTIQHDGYIINPESWTDKFLDFDYIGAPWPTSWGYKNRIGNGGFCLKSKKFLEISYKTFKDFNFNTGLDRSVYDISVNEDFLSCNLYYDEMIANGIKFADVETASVFSIEHPILEMKEKPLGFHGYFAIDRMN